MQVAIDDRPPLALPGPGDVRAELERVLSSPDLQASDRRRAFLRFIVEETLAGRADRLKGYTVALAVFGRDEGFDAQADPVVRLEARRLRRDLDSYYVAAGSRDRVRISIPKGSYVPRFDWHDRGHDAGAERAALLEPLPRAEPQPESAPPPPDSANDEEASADRAFLPPVPAATTRRRLVRPALLIGLVLIAAAIAAYFLLQDGRSMPVEAAEPAIVVVPFTSIGGTEEARYLAEGLSQQLIGDLLKFPGFRLYLARSEEADTPADLAGLAEGAGLAYAVTGSVIQVAQSVRVVARLIDARGGRVIWTSVYDRPFTPDALIATQDALAADLATAIGQPYGMLGNDLNDRIASSRVTNVDSYVCVLRAYSYRRSFTRDEFEPVLACLEQAVKRDPGYSDAWAMLGWMHLDAGRFGFGADDMAVEYQRALEAADHALSIDPNNTLALKAASSINHYMGRFKEGERLARRAAELNPHDPDALAQLGWRLAVRGNFDEGIPILRKAIERTVNPPGWYFHLIAVDLYLRGDYRAMLDIAMRSAADGSGISQALIAIAAGALGERETARTALEAMAAYPKLAADPAAYLRIHGATDEIVGALIGGLATAKALTDGG